MTFNQDDFLTAALIQKRPAMYIGGTDFFGFIQYIVSAFDLLMDHGATWIEIQVDDKIKMSSDAKIDVIVNEKGEIEPFEAFRDLPKRHMPDAAIVTALSEELKVSIDNGKDSTELFYFSGNRESFDQKESNKTMPVVHMEFLPNDMIFSVTSVSPEILHSYCRRMSVLHQGIAFRFLQDGKAKEYYSSKGMQDLFTSVTTPYQILHKPITVKESEEDLALEVVFAYQSWSDNNIWSFVNNGRVPDGGTHEIGLLRAMGQLDKNPNNLRQNGLLAVLNITYPQATYEGCVKARISNVELGEQVYQLVKKGLTEWLKNNPEEAKYYPILEGFQFAPMW